MSDEHARNLLRLIGPGPHTGPRRHPPGTIECPRCEGQRYDRGSCAVCANKGYLSRDGETIK